MVARSGAARCRFGFADRGSYRSQLKKCATPAVSNCARIGFDARTNATRAPLRCEARARLTSMPITATSTGPNDSTATQSTSTGLPPWLSDWIDAQVVAMNSLRASRSRSLVKTTRALLIAAFIPAFRAGDFGPHVFGAVGVAAG